MGAVDDVGSAWTAVEIAEHVREERCEPTDTRRRSLARIDASAALNTVITKIDDARTNKVGPLAGVPIAVKDNIAVAGVRLTCGSSILGDFVAPTDATAVARLRGAGATIVAKTNLDAFGMGGTGEHSAFGPTRNPWNAERFAGGSSSGSAAAVAAGLVPASLGSDTGGSVRVPAALCGVVGYRPTYGRVSRRGLVAHASSLDTVGPITTTVQDAALIAGVMSGWDRGDPTSIVDERIQLGPSPPSVRLGVPTLGDEVAEDVRSAFGAAVDKLVDAGWEVVSITLPDPNMELATYAIISTAEAASNLARFDGVRFGARVQGTADLVARSRAAGFGRETRRRILLGTGVLREGHAERYVDRARRVRTFIRRQYSAMLASCDVVATPTTPVVAGPIGPSIDDPLAAFRIDRFTIGPALAGLPSISVPIGLAPSGLPVGLQLIGAPNEDDLVLAAARAWEECRGAMPRPPACASWKS